MGSVIARVRAPLQLVYFTSHALTELPARISALGLVIASAGFGATFAFSANQSHGPLLAWLALIAAVALDLAKPLAVAGAFDAAKRWAFGRAAALAMLGLVAIAFSLSAELQLTARNRADVTAERATKAKRSTDAADAVKRLQADLKSHDASMPVAPPAPAAAPTCAGSWLENSKMRAACIEASRVAADAAKAHADAMKDHAKAIADHRTARASLVTKLEAAEAESAKAGVAIEADAGTKALATYLAAVGINADPAKLGDVLVLVAVLALEVGSAFAGLLVAGSPKSVVSREIAAEHVTVEPAAAATPAKVEPVKIATPDAKPSATSKAASVAERIRAAAERNGGVLIGTVRQISELAGGATSGTAHRALALLVSTGVAVVTANGNGTELRLLG